MLRVKWMLCLLAHTPELNSKGNLSLRLTATIYNNSTMNKNMHLVDIVFITIASLSGIYALIYFLYLTLSTPCILLL